MKTGYVAVIGKTNAGKSTLINKLLKFKLNIVSNKKQTTRNNILGILTEGENQLIFIDTPGIHRSQNQLDKFMNKSVRSASEGADVVVYIIDATKDVKEDEIESIKSLKNKVENLILGVNKIDFVQKEKIAEILVKLTETGASEIVPISAKNGKNVEELKNEIIKFLPEGEFIFGEDEITDKSTKFLCSEIVREKILNFTNQEIPHGVFCEVVSFKENQKLVEICVDVICEKDSHKSIIIGKGGQALKRIGTSARIDIEKFLGKKVMINLYVKVEKDWRNKQNFLVSSGYNN